ncbi:act minimal PKS acyl carrier protein [Saccharothrix saharensis]|uniref:Act minimal PKS acyl carrier protein n=1 Tax=Saccharothrix saharensis TaxID=571190 RepID=A0A543JQC2_9PSEU|nr:acyl carrier protein [Saccharothrix saharensis]TQM85042.1 act minimal PKS acyl carrier protein [Saccharothrix saharensis]
MSTMTIDDLRTILVSCAGEEESADLRADITDVPFSDLGYDSLALMETAARIERDFGISLPDEVMVELETPRALLDLVNDNLAGAK